MELRFLMILEKGGDLKLAYHGKALQGSCWTLPATGYLFAYMQCHVNCFLSREPVICITCCFFEVCVVTAKAVILISMALKSLKTGLQHQQLEVAFLNVFLHIFHEFWSCRPRSLDEFIFKPLGKGFSRRDGNAGGWHGGGKMWHLEQFRRVLCETRGISWDIVGYQHGYSGYSLPWNSAHASPLPIRLAIFNVKALNIFKPC